MFDTLIVQPVFNVLELIYANLPGHDLGISIILFTILVRLALWPLVKKQLHHAKAMRVLQPELKKIKKAASGDRQKEARLQMELYKERGIKPFASIGTLIIQIPIFIALYQAILKITNNPNSLIEFSYEPIRNLSWIQQLSVDINKFEETFLGVVDLTRRAVEAGGPGIYWPAIALALVSSVVQYYQTKMMMMNSQDARKLSVILKEAASGKEADQAEVTAAISKLMMYFLPVVTFIFALIVPAALTLYLLTSSAVGYLQQRRVLGQDAEEMHEIADEKTTSKDREKALVTSVKTTVTTTKSAKKSPAKTNKSRTKTKSSQKKKKGK